MLLVATIVLPRPAVHHVVPDAVAQILPTPTLPTLLETPKPKVSPTPDPKDTPKPPPPPPPPDDGGGGGGNDGGGGGNDDGGGGGGIGGDGGNVIPPDTDPTETKKSPHESGNDRKTPRQAKKKGAGEGKGKVELPTYTGTFTPQGAYDTEKLIAIANQLRALGMPMSQIMKKVYAPFIIGGKAAWTNTWGAPRYGPGPIVRTHEGQDVFCTYGDPVLATEAGTIEYDNGLLGGRVARLFRPDGSYWYYAHLSDWNNEEYPEGSSVEAGDIVGFCGNTGNAITTPSHVHFGWYQGVEGKAKDPMGYLVRWLHQAERRSLGIVYKRQDKLEKDNQALTAQRRFGDAFVPEVGEKLPGAFKVASTTVTSAVNESVFEAGLDAVGASEDIASTIRSKVPAPGSPQAQLDAILKDARRGDDRDSGARGSLSPPSGND